MTSPTTDLDAPEGRTVLRRGVTLLVEMIRTNPWPFAGALTGSLVFSGASVAGAIVLGRVVDDLIVGQTETPTTRAAILAGAVIIAMSTARAGGVIARRYFGIMATRRMQMEWFDRLSDHYLDQPLRFFHTQPTGKLLAHADNDAERSSFVMQPLPLSLGALVLLVFASINLAVLDPLLLAIGLMLFPTLIVMNRLYTTRVEGPSARAQAHVGAVSSVAHESFEGALVVKLLGLEQQESERLRVASDDLRRERLVIGRLRAAFEPGLDTLPVLGTIALLAVGASRVDSGAITTGDLVQAMTLFGILAFPMRVVGFLLEELPRSVVSRDRIVDVLDTDHADDAVLVADAASRRRLPDGPLALTVEGISFAYGPERVLHDVAFDVAPGEIVAVVGSTGSGKSTLCTLLAGLARPTSGEIRLGGVPLRNVDPTDLRDAVSLVFQETFLFADTVRENLTMGSDIGPDALAWAMDIAQTDFIHELAEGLDTVVGERGVTLSGGQRQRVALARAMIRHPRLLLLDDATSAIDPVVEQRILDGLRSELDTTTIVVAHRVATIRLADRVIFVDDGRVVADGAHPELLATNESYAALVRAYEQDEIS
ncbi:ABC transporter ATP-binding protein [Actinospongicola halichondriae]|uniref:ABC transporter ATP-binding protein n=1 Tax=Actinospongicola halichondriae TaxID=3236844 RepID=UPI003D422561